MKVTCLSVRQPWASLIIHSAKWCENRSKPLRYRGEIWIHAALGWDLANPKPRTEADAMELIGNPMPFGAIIGRANLIGAFPVDQVRDTLEGIEPEDPECLRAMREVSREPLNFFGQSYVEGPWCYLLTERRAILKPIPLKGRLGLWSAELSEEQLGKGAVCRHGFKSEEVGIGQSSHAPA
ncbi:MAG: ASCH domain-containing protein [Planctomycetota bacterium]|nr:ASCH domain-containing protein [Planctomycetaceae bacterium]MDQ3330427.1 ASCH domain-containing protein [Planctomycetota bacterium]